MTTLKRLRSFVQSMADRADMTQAESVLAFDLVRGITQAQSVVLSHIARALDPSPDTPLMHQEQRLSKALRKDESGLDRLQRAYLREVAPAARKMSFVTVDGSENVHLYGEAFEHLGWVQDRSKPDKPIVPGYWTVLIEASDNERRHLPLYHNVFSTVDPAYVALGDGAWQEQFRKGIDMVRAYVDRHAIWLFDRGFDDIKQLGYFNHTLSRFVVRMCRSRNVEVGDPNAPAVWNIGVLADTLKTTQPVDIEYVDKSKHRLRTYRLSFGWIPVRIPGIARWYYLIVVRGGRGEDWLLLCSWQPKSAREAAEVIQGYVRRWGSEEVTRCFKQCAQVEGVRVRTLRGIRRLLLLAMIAMGIQTIWLLRHRRLAHRLMSKVKAFIANIPFVHYRLWQGTSKALLDGT